MFVISGCVLFVEFDLHFCLLGACLNGIVFKYSVLRGVFIFILFFYSCKWAVHGIVFFIIALKVFHMNRLVYIWLFSLRRLLSGSNLNVSSVLGRRLTNIFYWN